jgi:hypothetical protein
MFCHLYISRDRVTIDGLWIGNWICWAFTHRNYCGNANSHTLLQHVLSLLNLLCLNQSLSGNGSQRRAFPFLWAPELSPCPSYQLPASNRSTHKDWTVAVLELTTSILSTVLNCTALSRSSDITSGRIHRTHRFQQYFHSCVRAAA